METTVEPLQQDLTSPRSRTAIAHPLHTLALLAFVALISFTGKDRHAHATVVNPLYLYASSVLMQLAMVGYIWMGIRRRGHTIREIVGGRWKSPEDVLLDFFTAACGYLVIIVLSYTVQRLLGTVSSDAAQNAQRVKHMIDTVGFIAPQSLAQFFAYIGFVCVIGFCEEFIFRGYLMRQFEAFTGVGWIALLLQAVVFGAAHGYQGVRLMIPVGALGLALGILAQWRKSLRPGMILHAGNDFIAGVVLAIAKRAM